MNCEKYQDLLSDFVDGSLSLEDCRLVEIHLQSCGDCAEAKDDLHAIVLFCREQRGEYDVVPNERALWLRISNTIESEAKNAKAAVQHESRWSRLMSRSWQLSFPQLAASAAALVILVALVTGAGLRGFRSGAPDSPMAVNGLALKDRYRQQQQVIDYWNQRVELNKVRWTPQMRDTFDRNMLVIDAAVNDSLRQLNTNPHDEVSEEILNGALNDKVALLKEFGEL